MVPPDPFTVAGDGSAPGAMLWYHLAISLLIGNLPEVGQCPKAALAVSGVWQSCLPYKKGAD